MKHLSPIKDNNRIIFLSVAAAVYAFGNSTLFFFLPLLLDKLTGDYLLLGLMIAIPYVVSMFFDVPTGELIDCSGRKQIIFLGLLGMILFALLLPYTDSLIGLALLLIILGFSNQLINVPIRSYVMEISPHGKTSEYFGIEKTSEQLGFALAFAPIIAGVLISEDVMASRIPISILYIITCLIAIIMVHYTVKETLTERKSIFCGIRSVVTTDRIFMKGLNEYRALKSKGIIIFLMTLSFVIIDGLIWAIEPLYNNLGIGTEMVGVILAMFVLPYVLFQIPAGFLADRYGKRKVLIIGLLIGGVFLLAFGLVEKTPPFLIACAFGATTGLAIACPSVDGLLTDISGEKQKGEIAGVWDISEDLGYVLGPIMGGLIAEMYNDISIPFIFIGALMLLLILPALFLPKGNVPIQNAAQ